jgi:ribonuclease P protein component
VLPKRYRLVRSEDFARIRREGECFSTRRLVLCYVRNQDAGLRVGFSVSKRVGGAVVRNRVKRRLRAGIRPFCEVIAPGWDLVVIARQQASDAAGPELDTDLALLLGKARLYRANAHVG